jgi:hypothetical protein
VGSPGDQNFAIAMKGSEMNADELQRQLQTAYADWKANLHFEHREAADLSAPLLLSVSASYADAKRRILFVGQETLDWNWTHELRARYPRYETDYPYTDIRTMNDFIIQDDAIDALCWGYREFDFSSKQSGNYNSPFWQAFREIQAWPSAGVIWNNISRCAFEGGSILHASKQLQNQLFESQSKLVATEIDILRPQVCLFFTGPLYDDLLREVFPGCEYVPVKEYPVKQLARLVHPSLPEASFRTYHPRHLRQAGPWGFISQLQELASN